MNPSQINQQAQQAATQGNQAYNSDLATSAASKADYGNYQAQANTAQSNLSDYTKYMQGAGSGTNLYNTGLAQGEKTAGYNEGQAGQLGQQLAQAQNALQNVNQASQSSTGGYGLSGAQLGNYYATQATPITSAVNSLSNNYGASQQALANATTIGNQYAGAGLQGEAQTSKSLNDTFANAKAQSDQALQNMQFYSQLASTQGGLNASQQQAYSQARQLYELGQQAIAQTGLINSQTTGQNLTNQATQAQLAASAAAQAKQASATAPASPAQQRAAQTLQSLGVNTTADRNAVANYSGQPNVGQTLQSILSRSTFGAIPFTGQ